MNRTARRLGLAAVGAGFAALAAFATAGPAAADNGPHIAMSGSSVLVAGVDGCAGCHRMHAAKGSVNALSSASVEDLCMTCHSGTGADTDVEAGVSKQESSTVALGFGLRAGGFVFAANGSSTAESKNFQSVSKVAPDAAAEAVTSSHTMDVSGTAWGSGTAGSGDTVVLECTSCHDPHGNGNYRILRPMGTMTSLGSTANKAVNVLKQLESVTAVASVVDTFDPAKFLVTFTTSNASTFVAGQNVTVQTDTGTVLVKSSTIITTGNDTFTVSLSSTEKGLAVGYPTANMWAAPAFPTTIVKASGDGTTMTFKTAAFLGLAVGQKVSIAVAPGGTGSAYKVTLGAVTSVTGNTSYDANRGRYNGNYTMFTIAGVASTTLYINGGLYITGIPDSLAADGSVNHTFGYPSGKVGYKKVYTTNDYWQVDDRYVTGDYVVRPGSGASSGDTYTATGVYSPYLTSVSQWCTTCHTRYLSSSTSRNYLNNDGNYRHASASAREGSPNCIQCHVAHGTNAVMTGTESGAVLRPNGGLFEGSALLRTDNRGVCVMCHQPSVFS